MINITSRNLSNHNDRFAGEPVRTVNPAVLNCGKAILKDSWRRDGYHKINRNRQEGGGD